LDTLENAAREDGVSTERAKAVAWIRRRSSDGWFSVLDAANGIERGEHAQIEPSRREDRQFRGRDGWQTADLQGAGRMSAQLPRACPYCRHTIIHVRVEAWAFVEDGDIQLIDVDDEVRVLDTEPNAVCAGCHGEFLWKQPK